MNKDGLDLNRTFSDYGLQILDTIPLDFRSLRNLSLGYSKNGPQCTFEREHIDWDRLHDIISRLQSLDYFGFNYWIVGENLLDDDRTWVNEKLSRVSKVVGYIGGIPYGGK